MKDLDFKIGGRSLDLLPNTTIQLELNTPLFDTELEAGSYSFPFSLPITATNQEIFGFAENPQSRLDRLKSYRMDIYSYGRLIMVGDLELEKPSSTRYSCNFLAPAGGISTEDRDKLLNELDLGSEQIPTTQVVSDSHLVFIEEYGTRRRAAAVTWRLYQDNLKITEFYFEVSVEETVVVNTALVLFTSEINGNTNLPVTSRVYGNSLVITPKNLPSSAVYRLEQDLKSFGVINGHYGYITATRLYALNKLIYTTIAPFPNASTANTWAEKYVFPMINNPNFYGTPGTEAANKEYRGYVNYYEDGKYLHNTLTEPMKYTLTPMLYFKWVLIEVFSVLGYTIQGDILEDEDFEKLLIYNMYSLDQKAGEVAFNFNTFARLIKYARHLPKITVGEFLTSFRNLFCLSYDYRITSKSISLRPLRDILQEECKLNWSTKVVPSHEITQEKKEPLKLTFALDSSDEVLKEEPLDPIFDASSSTGEEITIGFSPLANKVVEGASMPYTKQAGISNFFDQSENDFSPRLLFWKGLQVDADGESYPAADNQSGAIKLKWNGVDGLYTKFWKDYADWQQRTFDIEIPINFDVDDLARLDWSEKVHIRGVNYFVARINVTLPIRQPAMVTFKKA